MKGVCFDNIHSFDNLNLILAPFTPTPAVPKTNFLKVPGRDGLLDLTEANGEVKFDCREFTFTFSINPAETKTFDEKFSEVSSALNGRRFRITLDRDPDYYWDGRCEVSGYAKNKGLGQITVKATVEPYKLKQSTTVRTVALSSGSNQIINITNGRMPSVPTITCTQAGVEVKGKDGTYTLAAGTQKILGIRFSPGLNWLEVTGSGNIKFEWREGEL